MTRQSRTPLHNLRLSPTNEPFAQLVDQWRRGSLDPNPPYQRNDVWTLDQRIELIRSLLMGVPVPAIITNRRERGSIRYVIDGKQRVTTMRMWFDGELFVPASWFAPEDIAETVVLEPGSEMAETYADTGDYVTYTGLTDGGQGLCDVHMSVPVAEGRFANERSEAIIYGRVNGFGTPQTVSDMENARRVARGLTTTEDPRRHLLPTCRGSLRIGYPKHES